jgi:Tol biopolymer transport system component
MGRRAWLVVLGLAAVGWLAGCSFLGGDQGPELTHWEPALSPDGGTLAYESVTGKTLELYMRDLHTGAERRLTENEVEDWSPSWSPEGDRIAFTSQRDKNVDIYVLDVETRETSRITTHEADDINPTWGVDGRIYFNSNRSGLWEIYAIEPSGSDLIKITGIETTE